MHAARYTRQAGGRHMWGGVRADGGWIRRLLLVWGPAVEGAVGAPLGRSANTIVPSCNHVPPATQAVTAAPGLPQQPSVRPFLARRRLVQAAAGAGAAASGSVAGPEEGEGRQPAAEESGAQQAQQAGLNGAGRGPSDGPTLDTIPAGGAACGAPDQPVLPYAPAEPLRSNGSMPKPLHARLRMHAHAAGAISSVPSGAGSCFPILTCTAPRPTKFA